MAIPRPRTTGSPIKLADRGTDYLPLDKTSEIGRRVLLAPHDTSPALSFWGGMGQKRECLDKHEKERTMKVNPSQAATPGPGSYGMNLQRGKQMVARESLLSTQAVERHTTMFSPIKSVDDKVLANRERYPDGKNMVYTMPEQYRVLYPNHGETRIHNGRRLLGEVPLEARRVPGPGRYQWGERTIKSQAGQRRGTTVTESTLGKTGFTLPGPTCPEFTFGGTPHRRKTRPEDVVVSKEEYRAHPERLTRTVRTTTRSSGGDTGLLHSADMAPRGKLHKAVSSRHSSSKAFTMRGPGQNRSKFADGPPPRILVGPRVVCW